MTTKTVKLTAAQKLKLRNALAHVPTCVDNYTSGSDEKGRPSISRALHGRHNSQEGIADTITRFLTKFGVSKSDADTVGFAAYYSFTSTHSPVQNTKRMIHTLTRRLGLEG